MNKNKEEYEEFTLREIFSILKRRSKMIICIVLLTTAIVAIVNIFVLKPVYQASVSIIIGREVGESGEDSYDIEDLTMYLKAVETYVVIAESEDVARDACEILNDKYSTKELIKMINVEPKTDTQIMEINVQAQSKKEAKEIVQAVTEAFKKNAEELIPNGSVTTLLTPKVSDRPVRPKKFINIVLAFLISLFGSGGLVYALYLLNNTIKTKDEAENTTKLPVLGMIPKYEKDDKNSDALIVNEKPTGRTAEAFKMLRTNIQYSSVDNEIKTIMVTSTKSEEGKSTIICNLGTALANFGKRVIIIDGDMRKPTVHKKYKISNRKGLSEVLTSQAEFKDVVHKEGEQLYVLTAGNTPPNPSELLGSIRMKDFINRLRNYFDYVLIDTPPLMAVADAQTMSYYVDGVLMVIALNQVEKDTVVAAKEMLLTANANVLGMVLNKMEMKKNHGYYYQEGYYQIENRKNKKFNIKNTWHKLNSKRQIKKNNKRTHSQ